MEKDPCGLPWRGGRGMKKGLPEGFGGGSGAEDAESIAPALDAEVSGIGGEEDISSAGGEVGPGCWGEPGRFGGREIA